MSGSTPWFFNAKRNENLVPSDVDFEFAELKSMGIYAIPLDGQYWPGSENSVYPADCLSAANRAIDVSSDWLAC